MIKRVFPSFLIFIGLLPALAWSMTFDAFSKKMQQIDIIEGSFVQEKTLLGFPKPLMSKGHFLLKSQGGIIWVTTDPFKQQTIFTSKGIQQKTPHGEQSISVDDQPILKTFSEMLLSLLIGDINGLHRHFEVQTIENANGWTLNLTPKGTSLSVAIKHIKISGNAWPTKISINETNGDNSIITLSKHSVLKQIPTDFGYVFK